jgi:hypothetical protein
LLSREKQMGFQNTYFNTGNYSFSDILRGVTGCDFLDRSLNTGAP